MFLKITTPELYVANNEILIDVNTLDHKMPKCPEAWARLNEQLFNNRTNDDIDYLRKAAAKDYYGYENTTDILKYTEKYKNAINVDLGTGAAKYCMEQRINTEFGEYQGYLPAMGQMCILAEMESIINYINTKLAVAPMFITNYIWWSSTEKDKDDAWVWQPSKENENVSPRPKHVYKNVLPIFKKIK